MEDGVGDPGKNLMVEGYKSQTRKDSPIVTTDKVLDYVRHEPTATTSRSKIAGFFQKGFGRFVPRLNLFKRKSPGAKKSHPPGFSALGTEGNLRMKTSFWRSRRRRFAEEAVDGLMQALCSKDPSSSPQPGAIDKAKATEYLTKLKQDTDKTSIYASGRLFSSPNGRNGEVTRLIEAVGRSSYSSAQKVVFLKVLVQELGFKGANYLKDHGTDRDVRFANQIVQLFRDTSLLEVLVEGVQEKPLADRLMQAYRTRVSDQYPAGFDKTQAGPVVLQTESGVFPNSIQIVIGLLLAKSE